MHVGVADKQDYSSKVRWYFAVRSILGLMEPLISTLELAAQMVCSRQSCLFPELFCWGRQFSTRKQNSLSCDRYKNVLNCHEWNTFQATFPGRSIHQLTVRNDLFDGTSRFEYLIINMCRHAKTNPSYYPTMSQWSSSFSSPFYP